MLKETQGLTECHGTAVFRMPLFRALVSIWRAVLAVVLMNGCGGGDATVPGNGETAETQAENATPQEAGAAAGTNGKGADAVDEKRGGLTLSSDPETSEPQALPQPEAPAAVPTEAVRSKVVREWTDADFEAAVREHDILVLQAIDEKIRSAPGDAGAARLLTQLLVVSMEVPVSPPAAVPASMPAQQAGQRNGNRKRKRDDDDDEDEERSGFALFEPQQGMSVAVASPPKALGELTYRSLTERIITALIENSSAEAWQTVKGILQEQVKTPLTNEESGSLVVFEMIRRLGGSNGDVPNVLGAAVDGSLPLSPAARSRVLKIMTAVSSAAVDQLTGFPPGVIDASGTTTVPAAVQPPAAVQSSSDDDDDDDDGPRVLLGGTSRVNEQSSAKSPPAGVSIDLDEKQLLNAAAFLWRPVIQQKLFEQLQQSVDATAAAEVVSLCAAIPQEAARRQLYQFFQRHQADGAANWIAAGLFDANQHDPAMLVTLKALPRQRPVKGKGRRGDVEQPLDSWTQASMTFVFALRDRMRQNATKLTRYDGIPPVRLHKGANPDVSVMISLPGDQKMLSGDSAPSETRVYYTRVQYTPVSAKDQSQVAQHYEDRASGERRIDQQRGLLWFDGTRVLPNGTRRTVDIIIQAAGGATANNSDDDDGRPRGGGGGAFLIEVLVVEATNPQGLVSPKTAVLSK